MSGGQSERIFVRASAVMPGGVSSPVRAMGQIGRDPIVIERGEGCELIDADGNRYIDWIGSWGPLIHGHGEPSVVAAVKAAADRGLSFGAATAGEADLAEAVADRIPSVEMIRMTSSGTEAAMSAVRLARAVTGRDRVVKFAGAYHGHSDGLVAEAGSGVAEGAHGRPAGGVPGSPGVTAAQAADTVVIPWNDREAVSQALAGGDVATLIAEPVPANMGVVPPDPGFLGHLRAECDRHGTLLVLDEVITGFRVARGGAQELYGVMPDLTVLGKVLGGGLPAAALGGGAELMERLAPSGEVYQAGTLSGNPVAVAAGLATLELLDAPAYERLTAITDRLAAGLERVGVEVGGGHAPWVVQSVPGLLTPFFSSEPVTGFEGAAGSDGARFARFARAMLDAGIYPPPSRFEAWFPSLAHDEEAVDRTVDAAARALEVALREVP